jgi:hypothetical protein
VLEAVAFGDDATPAERVRALELLRDEPDSDAALAAVAREAVEAGDDVIAEEIDQLTALTTLRTLDAREKGHPRTAAVLRDQIERRARELVAAQMPASDAQEREDERERGGRARQQDEQLDALSEPPSAPAPSLRERTWQLDFPWPDEWPRRRGSLR